jgi:alkanesulfonate monooxygenase SsuD/methylene tetrahydromethanopterin reductase-like flavin-dependent oxidoreductase (luciferase family)
VTRYGVYLPTFGPFADPAVLVEVAGRAKAAGWDGVFLWEHVLGDGPLEVADPWVGLGAMAAATSRIRLGTLVSPLARRRPWVLARQAGTLSRLSGGRCVLGVGLGADDYGDFSRFGDVPTVAERAARADEALEIMAAMWAGTAYRHGRVDLPVGVAEPHRIPVWVAGTLPGLRAARRAARQDGLVLLGFGGRATPDTVAHALDVLRAGGVPADRPFDVVLAGNASAAWPDSPAVDVAALAGAGMTWWIESLMHHDPLELTLRVIDAGPEAVRAASPRS